MSQFMICKSDVDLKKYGGIKLSSYKTNNILFYTVLKFYYEENKNDDIWIIEDIHDYCNEVIEYDQFVNSKLYYILESLYNLCNWMILWYGSDYENLKEITSKIELLSYVEQCIQNPCCELYVRVCR